MDNRLFFMSQSGAAVELCRQQYEKEDRLQKIVEDNPHLLARAWGDGERRLFLIKRELEIMESEDSTNSYSLDHLLVGEDAVPVLVEVKRSTDTRIRREVVAQMLDYACRASTWNVDDLRSMFVRQNSDEVVAEFDNDKFWDDVSANLLAERMRLVFVADQIPDTLRVLIEFMDRSMKEIEVYGVELKPYQSGDAFLLSSSIVGNSLIVQQKAVARPAKLWDSNSFDDFMRTHGGSGLIETVHDLYAFSMSSGLSCEFGRGKQTPSYVVKSGRQKLFTISSWWRKTKGNITTAEFCIRDLLLALGDSWSESQLRMAITDMPARDSAYGSGLIWDSQFYLYIELSALLDSENLSCFKKNVLNLSASLNQE